MNPILYLLCPRLDSNVYLPLSAVVDGELKDLFANWIAILYRSGSKGYLYVVRSDWI